MRPALRIVCAGGAVVDRKLHFGAAPVPGTSNPARSVTSFGGVARNVAENLARLGVPVALVTAVGNDDAGRVIRAHLAGVGVDVTRVRVVPGAVTAEYVAMLDPANELVLAAAVMDVFDAVRPADLASAGSDWLVLDTNLPAPVLAHAIAQARAAGGRLAVDAVSTPKVVRLPADLRGVRVLFCNGDEGRALLAHHGYPAGDSDRNLARALLATGAQSVVLTRGARGVLVAGPAGECDIPAPPARVVDVTGAGDALVAGTIFGLFRDEELVTAVRRGVTLAALTVASPDTVRQDLTPALMP